MSDDKHYDRDHNPPLSQVLVHGPDHLVKSTGDKAKPVQPLHGVEPKSAIAPRPTPKEITYDPDAYRDPFGRQH